MKFKAYILILCILLTASFASAKEITCYSTATSSWFTEEGITCENKLFDLQDLKLLTSNFDRDDCSRSNIFCAGSDINKDGSVTGEDLALFTPSFCSGDNCTVVPYCGDLVCEGDENCSSCKYDCGECEVTETHRRSSGGSSGSSGRISMTIMEANESNSTNSTNSSFESEQEPIDVVATEPVFSAVLDEGDSQEIPEVSQESDKGMAATGMVAGDGTGSGNYKVTLIILIALLVIIAGAIVFVLRRRSKRSRR